MRLIAIPNEALAPDQARHVVAAFLMQRAGGVHDLTGVDPSTGIFCAVLLRSAVLDGALVWLVADDAALAEHPDILRSGFPVFFFDEIERLRGKTAEELRALGLVKAVFPTGRVLQ